MNNVKRCCGIGVSQSTLDVAYQNNRGEIFPIKVANNTKGFETILQHTGADYHFVPEASGVYYVRLAFFLYAKQSALSAVNALSNTVSFTKYLHLIKSVQQVFIIGHLFFSNRPNAAW